MWKLFMFPRHRQHLYRFAVANRQSTSKDGTTKTPEQQQQGIHNNIMAITLHQANKPMAYSMQFSVWIRFLWQTNAWCAISTIVACQFDIWINICLSSRLYVCCCVSVSAVSHQFRMESDENRRKRANRIYKFAHWNWLCPCVCSMLLFGISDIFHKFNGIVGVLRKPENRTNNAG